MRPSVLLTGFFVMFAVLLLNAPVHAQVPPEKPTPPAISKPMAVTVYGGRLLNGNFSRLFYDPLSADALNTGLVAITGSYRVHRFDFGLSFEVEAGVAQRFGDEDLTEFWAAAVARWDRFPWNDYVYTTLGVAFWGPNYSTEISDHEQRRNSGKKTHWMNMFSPEVTFAPPDQKDLELVLRLHHRSGVFGLYNGTDSGSTFWTAGMRYHF